jgi:hypothetical protein
MGVLLCIVDVGMKVTVHGLMLGWDCYSVRVDVGMGVLLCMGRCWDGSVTACMGRCWDGSAIVYVHVRVELVFYVDIAVQE